ncbi:MAG: right-handed parallel beta-helix repeat-containing protein [Saprospiraceae bacterium]|nr:right-handed parallel beta-helix repeat-containing protein [Saprospiraceae bacterium]
MPGKKLILGKARVFACNDLWESIEVQEGGTLEIVESEIKSGNFAFDAKANTKVIARQNSKISSGNHGGKIKNGTSIELRGIQFEKLKGGIIVDNTNLTLESFNFNQIGTIGGLPSVADPFEGNCISFLGGGAKSIMPASTGSEGYFFNANNGIYIDNGAHKISGYTFKGVNHGIYIKNTTGSASNIEKNIMDVLSNGIFLENNGALSSLIDNNEVRAKNPLATGIYVGGQTGNTIIKRNLIDMDAGFAGIQVSSCQNTTIENNNAFNNAPTGNKSDCIYISNSNNVVASCNTVSHSGSGHGTTAIEVEETMNGEYKCNTVTGADCGMVYIAFCKPSIISGNSLSQHDIGFVISNRASGSDGITGTQFFQGNILKNSGASSDAWNFAGSLNSISESLFKVSNQSPFIPNNIQDLISLGWFTQPEGSTEFTCGSSTCPNGVGRSSANSNETDQRNFLLNNDLSIGEFSDARTWSARFAILMDIKSNQMRDGISLEWLSKFKGSSLDIFSDVAILLNRSSLQNSELISLQNKKRSLYFFNSAESNQFLEQISELDNKMQKIVEKLKKEYLSLAKYEFESLSSLQNLSEYELNMQQVLLLELKAELDHTLDLKNDVLLKSIAEQCPYSGGLAVYRARMLRQLVAKDYNDLQTCGIRQNESEKKMGMYPTIEAYPIPFTDVIYINIQSNKLIDSYNYEIVDPQGKCVQTGIVSSQGQIQTYNLPMGIYFIKISEDANLICKIIK